MRRRRTDCRDAKMTLFAVFLVLNPRIASRTCTSKQTRLHEVIGVSTGDTTCNLQIKMATADKGTVSIAPNEL